MKKLLSLLLALAMCVSLAACGGGDDTPAPADSSGGASSVDGSADPADVSTPVKDEGDYCTNYDVMSNFEMYEVLPVNRLTAAPWSLAGGYSSKEGGRELTQEELDITLSEADGKMQIEFVDEETAKLVMGTSEVSGTYRILDDGASINFDFVAYVGMFTAIGEDETPMLVILTPAAPETVLYFTN